MSERFAVQNCFTDNTSSIAEEHLFAAMGHYLVREIQKLLGGRSQGRFIITLEHKIEKEAETWDPLRYRQVITFTIDKWDK